MGNAGQLAGFRPEHVRIHEEQPDAAQLDAEVEVVEYLGDEQIAHLRVGDVLLVAKLPADVKLVAGSDHAFDVPLDKVYLFDRESERALGTATH